MQVMQTSVLLKYKPLFAFLQRQAPNVAQEIQRSYVGAARVYYETGFRRYARSLGWIKVRVPRKTGNYVGAEPVHGRRAPLRSSKRSWSANETWLWIPSGWHTAR